MPSCDHLCCLCLHLDLAYQWIDEWESQSVDRFILVYLSPWWRRERVQVYMYTYDTSWQVRTVKHQETVSRKTKEHFRKPIKTKLICQKLIPMWYAIDIPCNCSETYFCSFVLLLANVSKFISWKVKIIIFILNMQSKIMRWERLCRHKKITQNVLHVCSTYMYLSEGQAILLDNFSDCNSYIEHQMSSWLSCQLLLSK